MASIFLCELFVQCGSFLRLLIIFGLQYSSAIVFQKEDEVTFGTPTEGDFAEMEAYLAKYGFLFLNLNFLFFVSKIN